MATPRSLGHLRSSFSTTEAARSRFLRSPGTDWPTASPYPVRAPRDRAGSLIRRCRELQHGPRRPAHLGRRSVLTDAAPTFRSTDRRGRKHTEIVRAIRRHPVRAAESAPCPIAVLRPGSSLGLPQSLLLHLALPCASSTRTFPPTYPPQRSQWPFRIRAFRSHSMRFLLQAQSRRPRTRTTVHALEDASWKKPLRIPSHDGVHWPLQPAAGYARRNLHEHPRKRQASGEEVGVRTN